MKKHRSILFACLLMFLWAGVSSLFAQNYNLFVQMTTVPSTGLNTVMCLSGGIMGPCLPSYPKGTGIALFAQPTPTFIFDGWSGSCGGMAPTCALTMTAHKTAIARFVWPLLTVTKSGSGKGTVRTPDIAVGLGGIDCGNTCSGRSPLGTTIKLVAEPDKQSKARFNGWQGDCKGFGKNATCTIPLGKHLSVTALFGPP